MGRMKRDLTFDSIADFVRTKYPSSSITTTDLSVDKPVKFYNTKTTDLNLAIAKDSYYIGAINYYWAEIEKDSSNYLSYYELAKAYDRYNLTYSLSHDKVIGHLNTCIRLNPKFEEAYLLKARIHEKNGKMKGIMMSEPHVDIIDVDEIIQSINCLNECLLINPDNVEARQYLVELNDRYGKKYKL
jgi:tetratricopeptide (TPR) repeat protein